MLLGSGAHTVWAFWEVFETNSWHEKKVIVMVGSWYVATIIGSGFGALLISRWTKKMIYVRNSN